MEWHEGSFVCIIISVFFGLIVGILLNLFIMGNGNIYKGPNSNIIKHNIFKENGKCYRLVPKIYLCPIDISLLSSNN